MNKRAHAKRGSKKIIAVGGDGTVHEVSNGVQQSGQDCIFGLVAAGAGNIIRVGMAVGRPVTGIEVNTRKKDLFPEKEGKQV
ncbi:diacylglycerol kinase family protein [Brevibacillus sp. NRS-1366]|uniref:diacylglycerol kinase family protein n=1 Tax=Brevibacillus sp. NRS-1366 TaxID=3233899 RepID=UPI003D22DCBD